MGKVKIEKKDVWIDMTPMSDVMVLLLTFFMLTSTFVKNEPVKVVTPSSVSEIKIPEKDVLDILVDKDGKIFMSLDKTGDLKAALEDMIGQHGVALSAQEETHFLEDAMFGMPMGKLKAYLGKSAEERGKILATEGVPTDSIDGGMSEFQQWVNAARSVNPDIKIALKADASTPYKTVKAVMSELQDMDESHYYMITSLKTQEE